MAASGLTSTGVAGGNDEPKAVNSTSGKPASANVAGSSEPASPVEAPSDSQLTAAEAALVAQSSRAERTLMERIFAVADGVMRKACMFSSVPVEFLAALTANESGGDGRAVRFEPEVYDHLAAVSQGARPAYGAIGGKALAAEIQDALHPKAESFHRHFLTDAFAERNGARLAETPEEVLRELATSWGFTQIMGYHMLWRGGEPRDLLVPDFHFTMALELLSQFAESYQLDVRSEFRELLGCWNTGRPYGETTDPQYVEKGLRRMAIYRWVCERRRVNG